LDTVKCQECVKEKCSSLSSTLVEASSSIMTMLDYTFRKWLWTNWNSWNLIAFTILFGYHNLSLFVSVIIKLRLSKITSPHSLFLKNHIIFFKCGIYKLVEHWKMMLANTSLINKDFFTITTAQLLFTNRTWTFALIQ